MTQVTSRTENKMGTMPMPYLILNMAGPLTVSLLVQSLYNVIDSLFIARLGEDALAAISLASTAQNLVSSTAAGLAVGINALVASHLGRGSREQASRAAMNGIFLEFCCVLLFFLMGLFWTEEYFLLQTTDEAIVAYGVEYLQLCLIASVGVFGEVTFERLLQSTGKTAYTMITQGTGAIINILLDGVFIFGWGGFPAMGIRGAALATVCGQCIAMVMALGLNLWKNTELTLSLNRFRPDGRMIGAIFRVGIPTTVMGTVSSVMSFLLNQLVASFSTTAVAVFGIYNRLQHFIQTPMLGLSSSLISVMAYNYGAADKKRLMQAFRWGMLYGFIVLVSAAACFVFFPELMMAPFEPTEEMLRVGVPIFQIVGFTFVFSPPSMICSALYQGMGNGLYSLIVTTSRQVIIRVPLAYFFAQFGDLSLIWLCWPISEICSDLITAVFFKKVYRTQIKPMGEENPL